MEGNYTVTELMVSLRRLSKKNELVKGIMAYGKKLTRRRHRLNTSLVRLGERSSDAKTVIMKFCSIIWPRYVQSLNGEIQNVLEVLAPTEQSDDASIHEITDIVFCNLAYGFRPDEYFFFRLRDLSPDQRREFISYRDGYDYCYALNDFNDKHIFTDRYEAAKKFHQYFGRDVTKVEGQKDREEFDKFVLKHRTFMLKPAGQSRGQGIEVLRVGSGEALDKIFLLSLKSLRASSRN